MVQVKSSEKGTPAQLRSDYRQGGKRRPNREGNEYMGTRQSSINQPRPANGIYVMFNIIAQRIILCHPFTIIALICFSVAGWISAVGLLQAQTVNLGDEVSRPIPGAGHDYIHLLSETVNPANGSLNIKIDLPTPKGRELSLPFAITYDSGEVNHFTSLMPGLGYLLNPGSTSFPFITTDRADANGG